MENDETEIKEAYLKKYGWTKTKGFKVDCEHATENEWQYFYFAEEDYKEYITSCYYWSDDNYEECFDDIDDAINKTEEDENEEYEDFKLTFRGVTASQREGKE